MQRWIRCLGIGLAVVSFSPQLGGGARATAFYVSPIGSTSGDGTPTKPWPTVEFALSQAFARNVEVKEIVMMDGTYRGPVFISNLYAGRAATPTSPSQKTIVRAEHKWKAVVRGSETHGVYTGDTCHDLIIDGLAVVGSLGDGVKIYGTDLIVRNCWINNNRRQGLSAHGVTNVLIEHNWIEYNGSHPQFDHGIYAGGDRLTIKANVLRHNSRFGLQLAPEVTNTLTTLNLIYGNIDGVYVSSPDSLPDAKPEDPLPAGHNVLTYNTIVNNNTGINFFRGNGEVAKNNILSATDGTCVYRTYKDIMEGQKLVKHRAENLVLDYNLCCPVPIANPGPGPGLHDSSCTLISQLGFVDAEKGNYFLMSNSPANRSTDPERQRLEDFWGQSSTGTPSAVGAFQYVASRGSGSPPNWDLGWGYFYSTALPLPDYWLLPE